MSSLPVPEFFSSSTELPYGSTIPETVPDCYTSFHVVPFSTESPVGATPDVTPVSSPGAAMRLWLWGGETVRNRAKR